MASFYDLPAAYYALLQQDNVVLLETTLPQPDNHHSYLFSAPLRIFRIDRLDQVTELLRSIQAAVEQGYYVAGYFSYECGYGVAGLSLRPAAQPSPLAWFGVYQQPLVFDHLTGAATGAPPLHDEAADADPAESYQVRDLRFSLNEQEYSERIDRVKAYICAGDTYQINFTGRYQFGFDGSALAFYRDLAQKQPVGYSAFLRAAGQQILCFSPELFFRLDGPQIVARPMKGTAPRGRTPAEDQQRAAWLHSDIKNRAENIMIVDLMRNDLGRISRIGSVSVPDLFTVERYHTLFQMTSTVAATLDEPIDYLTLFESLFPCGSITGAPKIRAMEIIHELENAPRGVYTGAIGYFAPSSATQDRARRAVFNVAIRTIVLQDGRGSMGVGSGIVYDSIAADEYAECAVKAQFLTSAPVVFEIIEAILWQQGFQRLEQHLARMAQSAAYFGYRFDPVRAHALLAEQEIRFDPATRYKVRLLLGRDGTLHCEALPLAVSTTQELRVALSAERTSSHDRFLQHKTTNRALYNRATEAATGAGYADLIFLNERGEVTEGATNSLFIERDGELLTPALTCGALNGIYRAGVLAQNPQAREAVLSLDDLRQADAIYLCNAIRGWRKVTFDPDALLLDD